MIRIRKAAERGVTKISWLDSRHSFSFGDYYDPAQMHWGPLRVINEDVVAPGAGFPTHPHREMEIVTWVLEGELAHKDSTGNAEKIRPGELQRMTAGTGITHSEFNASANTPVHLLQIWLLPGEQGLTPGYEQKSFGTEIEGRLRLVASQQGRDGSITIHQDANIFAGRLAPGQSHTLPVRPGRVQWVQVARGTATLNGMPLAQGDGAAVRDETALTVAANDAAELLVFDMAA
ncbi:MAG TPA: pirin family protein [Acetobacteraceae bacterium]|nr:pirin family protein [Acetobacteraceae bacterium]